VPAHHRRHGLHPALGRHRRRIVVDGKLLLGANGLVGEVGHLPAVAHGLVCRCAIVGAWETVASPVAIARLLQESWGEPVSAADLPN